MIIFTLSVLQGEIISCTWIHAENVVSRQQIQQNVNQEFGGWEECGHVIMSMEHALVFKKTVRFLKRLPGNCSLFSAKRFCLKISEECGK